MLRLGEVAAVQRKPGHGWRFLPTISDPEGRGESYRFRQIIEPAALMEPGYRLSPGWIEDMRGKHEEMLATPWSETTSIALYEMNAQFHEGVVAGARNRYLLVAIQQQNRLRRFANYDWTHRPRARGRLLPRASRNSRFARGGRLRGRGGPDAAASRRGCETHCRLCRRRWHCGESVTIDAIFAAID